MKAFERDYKAERYRKTGLEGVTLDMYLSFAPCGAPCAENKGGKNCVAKLKEFAEEYSFELNIKAAGDYDANEEELSGLMISSQRRTTFTEEDYKKLAEQVIHGQKVGTKKTVR